jgi:hypothetical protein
MESMPGAFLHQGNDALSREDFFQENAAIQNVAGEAEGFFDLASSSDKRFRTPSKLRARRLAGTKTKARLWEVQASS